MVYIWQFDLSEVQTLFSVFSSLSIGVAVLTYIEKKDKDSTASTIELISFFRKEIIDINNEFIRKTRTLNGKDVQFPKIKLDNPDIKYIKEKYPKEFKIQIELKKEWEIWSMQTSILNALEEMALKVYNLNISNHLALSSIKAPFVELMERHAVVLLEQRQIITGLPSYGSALNLYQEWKGGVDRRTPPERLKEL